MKEGHIMANPPASGQQLEQAAASARGTLLTILLLSVVNLVMLLLDTGRYFLFSTSIPYYATWFGKAMDNGTMDGSGSVIGTFTLVGLVISVVVLGFFLVAWLLSAKRPGWLTVAAVAFIVDTLALLGISFLLLENPAANFLDIVIHCIAIYQLIRGGIAGARVKAQAAPVSGPELDA